ncbi:YEATS family protein [Trichoderma harzianum]|uniref:YEATS family protein n=1 Tax=Trichoderma harzianum TaxID=5544 RepID=A0A0F9XAT2_TRIHA|nr:YEATS family protein [Trichoderma harzianum]
MADASSRPSTPVADSYSSMPSTPVGDSSMPSTPMEDSSMPFTSMEYSSRASTPVEDSSRLFTPGEYSSRESTPGEDSSWPSTPVEDSSKTPALPDSLMRRYREYLDRQAQKCAPKSDRMKIGEILEDLEDDRDAMYIIGLIQMYKGPNAKIKNDLYETGEFVFDITALPDATITMIWNYLSRRGII